jgi:AraC-like DNA-binding protein
MEQQSSLRPCPGVVADALRALGGAERRAASIDLAAVGRARDYLAAHAYEQTSAATLERVIGSDRFTLARHFRRAFGTSPDRYRMLRLALARQAVERGEDGVPTRHIEYDGAIHAFLNFPGALPYAWEAIDEAASFLRERLPPRSVTGGTNLQHVTTLYERERLGSVLQSRKARPARSREPLLQHGFRRPIVAVHLDLTPFVPKRRRR